MPEKILELLKDMSLTDKQLAEKLQLSVDEVNACLNHLYMTGFIKPLTFASSSCGGGCEGCNGSCGCNGSSYKIWKVV
ncbi:MAG: hypothetical protein IJC02_12735 [Lachnospiraceae bacterium]|nr:hypothetical protein [Lachnospiraceae bacterium]